MLSYNHRKIQRKRYREKDTEKKTNTVLSNMRARQGRSRKEGIMATSFRVTPAQLSQQAQELQSLNERFKTEVTAMTEKEQALSGMWEGEARNAFHNAYATDAEKFANFYNGINRFAEALLEVAKRYAEAETAAASQANTRT